MRDVDMNAVKVILRVSTEYFDRAKLFFNKNSCEYVMEVGLRVWYFMPYKGRSLQPKGSFKLGYVDFPFHEITQIYNAGLPYLEKALREYIEDFLESVTV